MVTPEQCLKKYGPPENEANMVMWDVPGALEIGVLPNRLYCNRDMVDPLTRAFGNIIERGHLDEIKTWDGCFNIRPQKGTRAVSSLHSWGIAVDINAAWNRLGTPPTLSAGLVMCFSDAGFDWGGTWKRQDGMHFQLKNLPA